jgi:hypothetical protein
VKAVAADGKPIKLAQDKDGDTYSFTMPASAVDINAAFVERSLSPSAPAGYTAGTIASASDIQTYKFSVTAGTAYTIQWQDLFDSDGSGYSPCDIRVSAWAYTSGTGTQFTFPLFMNLDSAYSAPFSFTASSTTVATVEVVGFYSSTGAYAIRAYASGDASKTNLLQSDGTAYWKTGSVSKDETVTYHMAHTSDVYLQWDDSGDGSGLFTADIKVTAADGNGTPANDWLWNPVSDWDSAYSKPVFLMKFAGPQPDLTVTVTGVTAGTFRIRAYNRGSPADILQ